MKIAVGFGCLVAIAVTAGATGLPEQQHTNGDQIIDYNEDALGHQQKRKYCISNYRCKNAGGRCQTKGDKCYGKIKRGQAYCEDKVKCECCIPKDNNECAANNGKGTCDHLCHNSEGSYSCSCRQGFSLAQDAKTCQETETTTPHPFIPINPILEACESKGGKVIGDECLFFSNDNEKETWQDANEQCLKKYGPLATPVEDPEELIYYIAQHCSDSQFWVGGYKLPNKNTFKWLSGTPISPDPTIFPWAPSQPISTPGNQSCMMAWKLGYNATDCDRSYKFACRLDRCGLLGGSTLAYQCLKVHENLLNWEDAAEACAADGAEGRLIVPSYPQLLLDYIRTNYVKDICTSAGGELVDGKCVTFNYKALSWYDAKDACRSNGGELASFDNTIAAYDYITANHPHGYIWTGGSDIDEEGTYRWLDGRTFVPSPWYPNRPWATLEEGEPYDCIEVKGGAGYGDYACNAKRWYICEIVTDQYFWVGGLQTNYSNEDSWYWLDGQRIPLGAENFPWFPGQPSNPLTEHCLDLLYRGNSLGYNDAGCNVQLPYICELKTTTESTSPVTFLNLQTSSGKFIGPNTVFPYIQNGDYLTLHFKSDPNMQMTFEIADGIWGYIRHVVSCKILTPITNVNEEPPMIPADGTKVVLSDHLRPWALFALDQYQNRIIHRSGKFISSHEGYIIITGKESDNMEFQFVSPSNPDKEVLPYGYPVISGDWQLVFSVLNPMSTHTYSSTVTIGRSKSLSSSHSFKYGFEKVKSESNSSSSSSAGYNYGFGSSSIYGHSSSSSNSHGCSGWPWSRTCKSSSSQSNSGYSYNSGYGYGSDYSDSFTQSSETSTTSSLSLEMEQSSSDTWSSESTKDISFTVEAGNSVAVWQRRFIFEHRGHKAYHLSNIFADTNSSRINPNNFGTQQLRFY